jgi:deazaflavin-dependent oxidoreductase (nitroreductase family)
MPEDFTQKVIDEFRANGGKVGGPFEGARMLLLHHRGAKTGTERVNPVVYQPVETSFAIFASKGGAPHHPHWFLNLKAHPNVQVEVGSETIDVTARELSGEARGEIWSRQKELMPGFSEYEQRVKGLREIPVILLERSS